MLPCALVTHGEYLLEEAGAKTIFRETKKATNERATQHVLD